MKKIVLLIIIILPIFILSQSNPFENLNYDKVIAYEFQGDGELLITKCLENEKDKISNSVELSHNQIKGIESILTSKSSYGNTTMSCFDPHFAIVYFLKDKIVGTVNVCLDCNYLISSEEIPATKMKYIKISEQYSYPAKGFSKIARKNIYEYCIKLGFNKYLKSLDSFYD
jgi:hypothetical protein